MFDGNGHTIDGVGAQTSGTGIHVGLAEIDGGVTARNVTVEDVVLTDWFRGLTYENVENSTIRGTTIESNQFGIVLFGISDIEVTNNVLTGNDEGTGIAGGTVTIVDTVASNEEVDYGSGATEDEGAVDHTVENFTLDTATISVENNIDQIDFLGGGGPLSLSAAESPPDNPQGLTNIGQYVEADTSPNTGGSFTLSVHYDDTDVPDSVNENSLALYQFADGEWSEIPNSSVDTEANIVSVTVEDPSVFADGAVIAPLGQVDDGDGKNGDDKDGDDKNGDGPKGDNGDDGTDDGKCEAFSDPIALPD